MISRREEMVQRSVVPIFGSLGLKFWIFGSHYHRVSVAQNPNHSWEANNSSSTHEIPAVYGTQIPFSWPCSQKPVRSKSHFVRRRSSCGDKLLTTSPNTKPQDHPLLPFATAFNTLVVSSKGEGHHTMTCLRGLVARLHGTENLAPTGTRSQDRPARSQPLSRPTTVKRMSSKMRV